MNTWKLIKLLLDGVSQWEIVYPYTFSTYCEIRHSSGWYYYPSVDAVCIHSINLGEDEEYWPSFLAWTFIIQWLAKLNTYMVRNHKK